MQGKSNQTGIPIARFAGRSLRFCALFFCASALVLTTVFWLEIPFIGHVLGLLYVITLGLVSLVFRLLGVVVPHDTATYVCLVSLAWALMLLPYRFVHLTFLHLHAAPDQRELEPPVHG